MYSYFASQDTLVPRARALDKLCLGQVRARAKVSCIKLKTRQGNFRFARKEVVLILVWYYCVYIYL